MAARELPAWLCDAAAGALLRVHVTPGAAAPGVRGLHGDALSVRVRGRPVEGAANRELLAVLAEALGVPRSALAIERGERGRRKRLLVRGIDAGTVLARLAPQLLP